MTHFKNLIKIQSWHSKIQDFKMGVDKNSEFEEKSWIWGGVVDLKDPLTRNDCMWVVMFKNICIMV